MCGVEFVMVEWRSNGAFAREGKNDKNLQQDDFTSDCHVPIS
jgi:hypothetical protein